MKEKGNNDLHRFLIGNRQLFSLGKTKVLVIFKIIRKLCID